MTIKEFSVQRGVLDKTVSRYLKIHGYTYDRIKGLSEEQLAFLDKKYPFPKPVEIVEDTESLKRLCEAQKAIIQLQAELSKYKGIEARLEASEALLEAKAVLLEDRESRIEKLEAEKEAFRQEAASYKKSFLGFYRKQK